MKCPECTQRIRDLRAYYTEHAPVAVEGIAPWKMHRTRLLYVRGWRENRNALTTLLRRAAAERYLLEHMEPIIDPGELLVGQPDLHPFNEEEQKEFELADMLFEEVIPPYRGRADHMALDYEKLLRVGVEGLIEEIRERDAALDLFVAEDLEKHEYYLGCLDELEGLLALQRNYAAKARAMAETADEPRKTELLEIAEMMDQVPAKPARTFREALESVHFYYATLFGIYSAGRPDYYLYPFYCRDKEAGVLTDEQAQELIDCFCLHYMTNMCSWAASGFEVGGQSRDGEPVENELTWMFLESIRHTRSADPSIGLAITEHTSEEILRFAAEILAEGHTHPALWNDKGIIDSMLKHGYDIRDARWWTHSTCVEITPIGKSGVSITSPYVNTLKVLLKAMDEADDTVSFEELVELFSKHMHEQMRADIIQENIWQIERARNGTDPLRCSCLVDDCLARGRSNDAGGAVYNFLEPNLLGLMNVTESLNVIHHLVYEEKRLTLSQFKKVLAENYENDEALRQYIINRVPHFGNNDAFSDALGKRVADIALDACACLRTYRGAEVVPGAFSYREHAIQGRTTPASPDGRKAFSPLTGGSDPVQGYDTSGPTASLLSTTGWQPPRFLGGTAVNLKLSKNTPDLPQVIVSLAKSYVQLGGSELQINIADADTLRDAQRNPEAHADLLVRIGGYSDFFVRIDKDMQDEIIRRTAM